MKILIIILCYISFTYAEQNPSDNYQYFDIFLKLVEKTYSDYTINQIEQIYLLIGGDESMQEMIDREKFKKIQNNPI